jgi:hypothetical protein
MRSFKKNILFSLLITVSASIQSAQLFKTPKGEARAINPYNLEQFKGATPNDGVTSDQISADELFIVMDSIDTAKLAFFEEKSNGRYQVNFFNIQKPNISAEFSTEQEAQDFLYDFMVNPAITVQRPFFTPLPPRGSGQGWRRTSAGSRRR